MCVVLALSLLKLLSVFVKVLPNFVKLPNLLTHTERNGLFACPIPIDVLHQFDFSLVNAEVFVEYLFFQLMRRYLAWHGISLIHVAAIVVLSLLALDSHSVPDLWVKQVWESSLFLLSIYSSYGWAKALRHGSLGSLDTRWHNRWATIRVIKDVEIEAKFLRHFLLSKMIMNSRFALLVISFDTQGSAVGRSRSCASQSFIT